MASLPADIEVKVKACEKKAEEDSGRVETLERKIDELATQIDDGVVRAAIDEDDPSVVRHVADLKQTAARVRRDSDQVPSYRRVADTRYRIPRQRMRPRTSR